MSRLTIDLTDEQHKTLKAIAALEGKTMKQYSLERLLPAISNSGMSDADQAWEEFKELIGKRVDDALANPASWRTFDEVWPDDGSLGKAA